jgi:hypothetical protein
LSAGRREFLRQINEVNIETPMFWQGTACVITERWSCTLEAQINRCVIDPEQILKVARVVARALAYLHAAGTAHGMVRADHIYEVDGQWKIGPPMNMGRGSSIQTRQRADLHEFNKLLTQCRRRVADAYSFPRPVKTALAILDTDDSVAAASLVPVLQDAGAAMIDRSRWSSPINHVNAEWEGECYRLQAAGLSSDEIRFYRFEEGWPSGLCIGDVVLYDDLVAGEVLGPCEARLNPGQTETRVRPGAGDWLIAVECCSPLAIIHGGFALRGHSDVCGLELIPETTGVRLQWRWPRHADAATIVAHSQRFPVGPADSGAMVRARCTRGEYELTGAGGYRLALPSNVDSVYIVVYAERIGVDTATYYPAAGANKGARCHAKLAPLRYHVRRAPGQLLCRIRGVGCLYELSFARAATLSDLPNMLLVAQAGRMPTEPDDGQVITSFSPAAFTDTTSACSGRLRFRPPPMDNWHVRLFQRPGTDPAVPAIRVSRLRQLRKICASGTPFMKTHKEKRGHSSCH